MTAKNFLLLLLVVCGICRAEIVVKELNFSGQPLSVGLPVNSFVTLFLPESDWAIGVPAELSGSLESHSTGRTIELRAKVSFQETLVPIRNLDNQQQIILRLSASNKNEVSDFLIRDVYAEEFTGLSGKPVDINKQLTRYASLSLYAPLRLRPNNRNIRSIPIDDSEFLVYTRDESGACIRAGLLKAEPIASWSSGHHYITALRVENISKHKVVVDGKGCHVPGDWLTSTWQHTYLESARPCSTNEEVECKAHFREVTILFLTSKAPFWTAVSPFIKTEVENAAAE